MRPQQPTQAHASPQHDDRHGDSRSDAAGDSHGPLRKPTMTVREAAAVLGIDRGAAYDAVRRGELPALRIGRKILVLTAPIRAMLGMAPLEGEHLEGGY